jgi:outer membrane biosynthesis protein TonB
LHFLGTRVIHVVTVITAKGEITMTELIAETAPAQAPGNSEKPKAAKKARVAPQRADVAKKKGKSGKKASPAKKAPKGAKKATGARDGSKTAKVLDLPKRAGGVTAKELMPYASHCTSLG